jgi:hypothetical protein
VAVPGIVVQRKNINGLQAPPPLIAVIDAKGVSSAMTNHPRQRGGAPLPALPERVAAS